MKHDVSAGSIQVMFFLPWLNRNGQIWFPIAELNPPTEGIPEVFGTDQGLIGRFAIQGKAGKQIVFETSVNHVLNQLAGSYFGNGMFELAVKNKFRDRAEFICSFWEQPCDLILKRLGGEMELCLSGSVVDESDADIGPILVPTDIFLRNLLDIWEEYLDFLERFGFPQDQPRTHCGRHREWMEEEFG